jgi:arylsulfatase A-like enzyme
MKIRIALSIVSFGIFIQVQSQQKPNILFIAIDDLNNYIECMGGMAKTPNIDALAKKGVLFNNAYCAAPACNPSRAAIMTGLRPETTGQYTNQGNFRDIDNNKSIVTLPQKLQQAGYETIAAGKIFHFSAGSNAVPNALSDPISWTSQVAGNTGTAVPQQLYLTKAGVAKWLGDDTLAYANGKTIDYLAKASIWGVNATQTKEQTGDWKMSEAFAEYIKTIHEKPFFFGLGFSKPHQPLIAPKEFFDLYPLEKITVPEWFENDMEDIPEINKTNFSSPMVKKIKDKGQLKLAYQAYLACISFTDACIGNALKALGKSQYATNTIVVLFSDHGFQLGQKNRWEKYSLWRLSTNAPLIIYNPNNKVNGAVCNEAVSLMDIHPTLLELIGLPLDNNLECTSLVPQLNNVNASRELPAVVTHEQNNHSIVWKQWNYIQYNDGSEELYNHENDIDEKNNLSGKNNLMPIKNKLGLFIPKVKVPQTQKGDMKRIVQ